MDSVLTIIKGLPLLAVAVAAGANYPPIPADLTTPVQQRLAINGPTCTLSRARSYQPNADFT
jgi:hypothetical protein